MEKWYFTFGKGMFLEDVSLANRVVEIEENYYRITDYDGAETVETLSTINWTKIKYD